MSRQHRASRQIWRVSVAGFLLSAGTIQLTSAPQFAGGYSRVTVDPGDLRVVQRSPISYPEEARRRGIAGIVSVRIRIGDRGEVTDASIISGPAELRKAVLASILNWRFDGREASGTRILNAEFSLREASVPAGALATASGG